MSTIPPWQPTTGETYILLVAAGPAGLTRSELVARLGVNGHDLDTLLEPLAAAGLIHHHRHHTGRRGRPPTTITATRQHTPHLQGQDQ